MKCGFYVAKKLDIILQNNIMGIYTFKSPTCHCIGSWSSLTQDTRFCLSHPCSFHSIKVGNIIWYDLRPILRYMSGNNDEKLYKSKYALTILDVVQLERKKLIKVEVKGINATKIIENKQIYYSDMNDESMWQKITDDLVHLIFVYDCFQHCDEGNAEWLLCNDD